MPARGIFAQRRRRVRELAAVVRDLARQALKRRPGREQETKTHARRHGNRAVGGAGEEDRRVRLLQGMWKQFVLAVDLEAEMLAAMVGALFVQQVKQQRQRLLLDVAPALEIDAKALEFVLAIAGA